MRKGKIKIHLEELIKNSGLSKTKFSYRADMQMSQVNAYCNNTIKRLDVDVLARICDTLGCSIADLLEYTRIK
ncbi:helix-turn-helix domain-containing protein [Dielma fastidiosa]|uniref:Putative transcriptional regulator n=1 Tax=Dielma fastidiosa TaxID=1034346 RepID=A0A318L2F4_9FIRM|nr:helix-turn-helix transcriptional regulator [Dielma fastidiosa]PXX74633.1 putative transcriptional regulator [Dielma fastidiosa]